MSKKGVTESFPFDDQVLVFKVRGKMFALADVDLFQSINLKCDPARAIELREKYPSIVAGYHMHKKHWNTLSMDGLLSDNFVEELIDHSYDLVVAKMPKKLRDSFNDF